MKSNKNIFLIILTLIFLSSIFSLQSQETSKIRSRLKINFYNESGVKSIVATLIAKKGKRYSPCAGLEVNFYYVADTLDILIGTNQTDEKGNSVMYIADDFVFADEQDGIFSYKVTYEGNDEYKPCSASTEIKNIQMEISYSQIENEKLIILFASEILGDGSVIPIDDVEVMFYVPRTFTLLKVGEGTLSNGEVKAEFPTTLPGDSLGYLTIVAKIEDNDDYGNAETRGSINWGTPLAPMKNMHRGLGDTNAPLWMVYTLIVLLSTVWFHYLYVIYMLYRINREAKIADINPEDLLQSENNDEGSVGG